MGDDKLDLITKLLAKAESTTPEEAEALTEHAERLMVKYGIEQARIDERRAHAGQSREEIVQEQVSFVGSYARDMRELGIGISRALGTLRLLQADFGAVSVLYLVGYQSDVQQARILTASLQVQAMVAMRTWWKERRDDYRWSSDSERRRARSGFVRGFGAGAASRIAESRRSIVEESGSGTELVLTSRRERVDAVADGMGSRPARRRHGADAGAFVHGHRSGREAQTGGRPVTGGRGLPG